MISNISLFLVLAYSLSPFYMSAIVLRPISKIAGMLSASPKWKEHLRKAFLF